MMKKRISLVLIFMLLFTFAAEWPFFSVRAEAKGIIRNPRVILKEGGTEGNSDYVQTVWDRVAFGRYQQTMIKTLQPIKWRILAINGDDAFLMSDRVLDARNFGTPMTGNITWENSSIRSYLNGTFLDETFSDPEKAAILPQALINEDTPDRVYLLSYDEVTNEAYGFLAEPNYINSQRAAYPTDYAVVQGIFVSRSTNEGQTQWWLRSKGREDDSYGSYAQYVQSGGVVSKSGYTMNVEAGIRPVLHVRLSADCVKDAGIVSSDGAIAEPEEGKEREKQTLANPKTEDGVVTWDCVWLGSCYQDLAFQTQPIEWRVLSVNEDGSDAFVMADRVLDCKQYHSKATDWNGSSLRSWLNTDFYATAFTEEERDLILETDVENEDETGASVSSRDRIYLLSLSEAKNEQYGFDANEDKDRMVRFGKPTDYAKLQGAEVRNNYNTSNWWLRTIKNSGESAHRVYLNGYLSSSSVTARNCGVRPVMHINLNSDLVIPLGTVDYWDHKTTAEEEWEKLGIESPDEINDLIDAIGEVSYDEACLRRIKAARMAFDTLSDTAKERVSFSRRDTLKSAEAAFAALEEEAVKLVIGLIDAIGTVTEDASCRERIRAARQGYDALPESGKKKIPEEKRKLLMLAEEWNKPGKEAPEEKLNTPLTEKEQTVKKTKAPKKVKITYIKRTKRDRFVMKWKKVKGAKGYQVCYATDKKFKKQCKKKTVRAKGKLTVKKLKKSRRYYVRIRAFKKDAAGKKVYGPWSKKKRV